MADNDKLERLTEYGNQLKAAGFDVWVNPSPGLEYLVYMAPGGCYGTLQESEFDGWGHYMPLKPSREFGSSMFLDTELDPWTVDAARECAQPVNHNHVIGWQANARTHWMSPNYVSL